MLFLYSRYSHLEKILRQQIILNNDALLSKIAEKYPDLEEDMLLLLVSKDKPSDSFLEKYGLDTIDYYLDNSVYLSKVKKENRNILYCCAGIFLSFLILFLIYLSKRNKKLKSIDQYLYAILKGDYSLDIRDYKEDDLSLLKDDIYKVTVQLKEAKELLQKEKTTLEEVLANISHQIKTPLTSMYVMNEILLNDKTDPKMQKELLLKNQKQLERIEWLITSLLKLSRLDSGTIQLKEEEISFHEVVQKVLEQVEILSELKQQTITIQDMEKVSIVGDFEWTREAILNIVKNAIEHTPKQGHIRIYSAQTPLYTSLFIENTGSTIAKEDLPHIFKRFYKGKNHHPDSIGIGLNMSKTIIEREHGEITVTSQKEKTIFSIKFYKVTKL